MRKNTVTEAHIDLAEMRALKARLEANRKEALEIREQLHSQVMGALGKGYNVSFISLALGITRQTIYNIKASQQKQGL